ncbi:MAG: hypothetical protein JWM11_4125 [Planctomycetaceae bacterium]|nr:hypothetical protein [Planctomycetaceae bacterium]
MTQMVRLTRRQLLAGSLAGAVGLNNLTFMFGSQRPKPVKPPKRAPVDSDRKLNTAIHVELLTDQAVGVGFNVREWSEIFAGLDVQFTIRRALAREEPDVTENVLGTTSRDVHVTGRLDRDGSISFLDRKYTTGDVVKIRAWIADMKLYGAQGTPKGQPVWGLGKDQFEPLFQALSPVIDTDLADLSCDAALQKFTIRKHYPLRMSATAAEHLRKSAASKTVQNQYRGLSEGAVLAAMLNEFGLGFRPRRTPDGKLELEIVKLGERGETWPAGWPPSEELVKLRPVFFQSREVELTDEPLLDIVETIADLIEMPVLIDEYGLKSSRIDVRTKKVSHKKKKVILSAALKHVCFQAKCKYEFRMDEAGKPLLWLTPDVPPKDDQ